MANYIISYDLNGQTPTHQQMDAHLEKLGASRGRILETVWYVGYAGTTRQLFDHISSILSGNDRLIVVAASDAVFTNLLITEKSLVDAWGSNR